MIFLIGVLIVIAGLYLLHSNRNEDENSLGLKLFGYYILGSFTFIFNGLVIPLGFIITLFMRPQQNRSIKRGAAVFGLVMMILGRLFT